jgi:hypothetical protein
MLEKVVNFLKKSNPKEALLLIRDKKNCVSSKVLEENNASGGVEQSHI